MAFYSKKQGVVLEKGDDRWTRLHEIRHRMQEERWHLVTFFEDWEVPFVFISFWAWIAVALVVPTMAVPVWEMVVTEAVCLFGVFYCAARYGVELDAELYAMRLTPRRERLKTMLKHVGVNL